MTVQTTTQNLPVVTGGSLPGLDLLSDWLTAAGHAETLARQLVRSFFVPAAYKPDTRSPEGLELAVANATGAILLGQSLGLDPLTSLQQIYVVHGRPGMYAKMKVALAQAAGHRITEVEYGPERSTWEGQRAGSSDVVRITLTIDDAKRAGWTSNPAYAKTPADMLAARCSSRVVDRVAADALFGIRSIEDLNDGPEEAPAAVRVTASAITTPAAVEAAPSALLGSALRREAVASTVLDRDPDGSTYSLPGEDEPSPERTEPEAAQVPAGQIGEDQWRAINAAFVKLGVTGPGQSGKRLAVLSYLAERTIAKGSDLTANEAAAALDALTAVGAKALVAAVLTQPKAEQPEQPAEAPAPVEAEQDLEPPADDPWRDAPQVQG